MEMLEKVKIELGSNFKIGDDVIQYYINKGRPVIGIGETGSATLLIGYDGISFTVLDPKSGRKNKMTVKVAEKFFDEAGNVFLSFIE